MRCVNLDCKYCIFLSNGKSSFAIYADIGTVGEGSVALADALGIRSDARQGGESDGILYMLFPGTGNQQPRAIDEIQSEGEKLLQDNWGRIKELSSCIESDDPVASSGGFLGAANLSRDVASENYRPDCEHCMSALTCSDSEAGINE